MRASTHNHRRPFGKPCHIGPDDEMLHGMGITVHWVNRGGGCVLHLPGQLAAYFAVPLDTFGLKLQGYLDRLHSSILRVLAEFDLTGSLRPDLPGVFSGPARIATVGVAVSRSIAYHGLTLNVGPYLECFDVIDEPGIGKAAPAVHIDGISAAAAYRHAQGSRGIDPESRTGLRPGTTPRLYSPPADSPQGVFSCLCSQSRVIDQACPACRSLASTSPASAVETAVLATAPPPARRLPEWLKRPIPAAGGMSFTRSLVSELGLETVCESARCPNRSECWTRRTATFMILGEVCTRPCGFCAVKCGEPEEVALDEPDRLAEACHRLGLRHVVITSVTRDDLEDRGADHFRQCVLAVRRRTGATIEVLTPDFDGRGDLIDVVLSASPKCLIITSRPWRGCSDTSGVRASTRSASTCSPT